MSARPRQEKSTSDSITNRWKPTCGTGCTGRVYTHAHGRARPRYATPGHWSDLNGQAHLDKPRPSSAAPQAARFRGARLRRDRSLSAPPAPASSGGSCWGRRQYRLRALVRALRAQGPFSSCKPVRGAHGCACTRRRRANPPHQEHAARVYAARPNPKPRYHRAVWASRRAHPCTTTNGLAEKRGRILRSGGAMRAPPRARHAQVYTLHRPFPEPVLGRKKRGRENRVAAGKRAEGQRIV